MSLTDGSLETFALDALRSAVVLGVVLALLPLLRRASAATRRALLVLGLAGALVVPLATTVLPAWRLGPAAPLPMLAGFDLAEPVAEEGAPLPVAVATDRAPEPVRAVSSRRLDAASLVGLVWAMGALLVALRLALGLVRSRAMVKRARRTAAWATAVRRAEAATGLCAIVRVTPEVDAPAVTGVLTPVVLVPPSASAWTDERRYATLLHELAHVRHHDCLAQIVAQLACAVHWFNPLAWLAARRLRLERELAADDAVLLAGARATSYAEDLLAIAGVLLPARAAPSGTLGMASPSQLAVRIAAVVSADRARTGPSRLQVSLLGLAMAVLVALAACASPRPAEGPSSTSTSTATSTATPTPTPTSTSTSTSTSTLDRRIQGIADEELDRAMGEWKAASGVVLVLDPATGEILANAGRAGGVHVDVGVQRAFITGSTLKAFTLAAALQEGVLDKNERIDCERGAFTYHGKVMHDAGSNGVLTVAEMLAVSTNVGFTKVFDRLGGEKLGRWLRAFHFGTAPGIEGANAGQVPARIEDKSYAGAVAAIGEEVMASPLQVAAGYAALANGGVYVAPTLTKRTGPAPRETLLTPETARTMLEMLDAAVNDAKATGKAARVAGVRVAGKTGTAGWTLPGGGEGRYASFVGFLPANAPRFVILVGLEQPHDDGAGGTAAAPVFSRVAARALGGG